MTNPVEIFLLALAFGLTLGIAIGAVKGFGLIKIGWLNFARLKELEKQKTIPMTPLNRRRYKR